MSLVGPDVVDDVLHSGVRLHVSDHDIWNTKRRHVTKCTCNDNIIIYTHTIHHACVYVRVRAMVTFSCQYRTAIGGAGIRCQCCSDPLSISCETTATWTVAPPGALINTTTSKRLNSPKLIRCERKSVCDNAYCVHMLDRFRFVLRPAHVIERLSYYGDSMITWTV